MCAIVYDNIRLSIRHRKYGSITKYKGTRLALVQFGSPHQSCDARNPFRQASKAREVGTIPLPISARRNTKAATKVVALVFSAYLANVIFLSLITSLPRKC